MTTKRTPLELAVTAAVRTAGDVGAEMTPDQVQRITLAALAAYSPGPAPHGTPHAGVSQDGPAAHAEAAHWAERSRRWAVECENAEAGTDAYDVASVRAFACAQVSQTFSALALTHATLRPWPDAAEFGERTGWLSAFGIRP